MRKTKFPTARTLAVFVTFLAIGSGAFAAKKRQPGAVSEKVDHTLSFAVEAMQPFVQQGFTIREQYWSGKLDANTQKAIAFQLFKGNEYWFCASTDSDGAVVSVHVYDEDGNLNETEYWRKAHAAGVHVVPRKTSIYYLIIDLQKPTQPETRWALVYALR